jgi:hypothetical protein
VRGIRAATFPAPAATLDDTLIDLPTKLGGVGILSFKTCAPLAYAAVPEASNALLGTLLGHDIDIANQTVLPQRERERCPETFRVIRESVLEYLDP